MATATKTRAKTKSVAAEPRIDGRMRDKWLQETQARIEYVGDECVISLPNRTKTFRGKYVAAVHQAMAAFPIKSGK
jgi:hypothetical protein